jgi:hypothetical protein
MVTFRHVSLPKPCKNLYFPPHVPRVMIYAQECERERRSSESFGDPSIINVKTTVKAWRSLDIITDRTKHELTRSDKRGETIVNSR